MRWVAIPLAFLVYSNLFIAGYAVLMTWQTGHLLLDISVSNHLYWFIFSATICSYSFHWYLTPAPSPASPREHWLQRHRKLHLVLFFAGLLGALVSGWPLRSHWHWLGLAAVITFLYSAPKVPHPFFHALRRIALGKTIFLAMVWMYVTTLLPLLLSDEPWTTAFTLFAIYRFFLIYAICILFDYRDREYDRSVGIKSLITWMSDRSIAILFVVSLIISASSAISLAYAGFDTLTLTWLVLPILITGIVYRYAIKNFGDLFYYFFLDGLMALSAFLMWIGL